MTGVFERVTVELLPLDMEATRDMLSGTGVDDEFREVRSYDAAKVVTSAKQYAAAITFPARVLKERDRGELPSSLGDVEATRVRFEVDMVDLARQGLVTTTGSAPFKKGDRVSRLLDWQGFEMQVYPDLYVSEVQRVTGRARQNVTAMAQRYIVLVCGSRGSLGGA